MERNMSLEDVLALLCADVDIFLLKEDDQKTDKDKVYTASEIRNQLKKSSEKLLGILLKYGIDVDRPL